MVVVALANVTNQMAVNRLILSVVVDVVVGMETVLGIYHNVTVDRLVHAMCVVNAVADADAIAVLTTFYDLSSIRCHKSIDRSRYHMEYHSLMES